MTPSSTSSSRSRSPRRPWPWALFAALGLVLAVELFVRALPPEIAIPYDYGEVEYHAARAYLDVYGTPPVLILGSSRAKEGLVMPDWNERLRALGFDGTPARNFAVAGARADEVRALGTYALARGRPAVLLIGVSPRMLLGEEPRWSRSALYWSGNDWLRHFEADPPGALAVLPVMARNGVAAVSHAFRYRLKPTVLADQAWRAWKSNRAGTAAWSLGSVLRGEATPSPMRGEYTLWQRDVPERSLVNTPISDEHVSAYVERLLIEGEYRLGRRRVEELRALVRAYRDHEVPVVFFEVPVSPLLRRHLPPGVYERFLTTMKDVASESGAVFVHTETLGLTFDAEDFAEQSHLNRRGAERLGDALFEGFVLPALRDSRIGAGD